MNEISVAVRILDVYYFYFYFYFYLRFPVAFCRTDDNASVAVDVEMGVAYCCQRIGTMNAVDFLSNTVQMNRLFFLEMRGMKKMRV